MRLSVWPSLQRPWSDVLDVVRHVDATGWDAVYVADHFMGSGGDFGTVEEPTLEATAALGVLAGATTSVRLGTLVLGMTYRHPAVLANWAATMDQASGGRLVLGVGAGWQENEHDAYGIRLGPPGERLRRFAEGVEVLQGLLRQPRTTVEGEHYRVVDAVCEPKPVQDPLPLLVGGKGDRMLRLVARAADAWNMWSLPDAFSERSAELDRACEEVGRDPGAIDRTTQALVLVTDDRDRAERFEAQPRAAIAGPAARVAEVAARWRDVGVDELIVPDWALGTGARRRDALDALLDALAPLR